MPEIAQTGLPGDRFVYRVIRYSPSLVRDEWVNIGVLVFHSQSGELRLRLIEGQDEYHRVRRFHPEADESALRALQEELQRRFEEANEIISGARGKANVEDIVDGWDRSLSNGVQLAGPKGVLADNLDEELERLYEDHVAVPRGATRVGLPGSRSSIRTYCSQVFRQARIWDRLSRSVRVSEFTFPGDPMRLDFSYRRNGSRGFVHAVSVSRAPQDAKLLAYTAKRIQEKAYFDSQFAAVTDVALNQENERHRFVGDTLRDAGIEPIAMEAFATWVPKLKTLLQ
jgi:Protein of unknown function (DUF3037)